MAPGEGFIRSVKSPAHIDEKSEVVPIQDQMNLLIINKKGLPLVYA